MKRPALKPLNRVIDRSRPALGEMVFSSWGFAPDANRNMKPAAVCKVPGRPGCIFVLESNVQAVRDANIKATYAANGTRPGRPLKVRQHAPAVIPATESQKQLLMQRLGLTEAELADALAD